ALWSAIAAAMMLYYRYPRDSWVLPSENPGRAGALIFVNTLEFGGWAMVLATLGLLAAMRRALAFDAVASVLIGALFVISGVLLFSGGGMQPIMYAVFGIMFIASSRNSWREYVLSTPAASDLAEPSYDPHFAKRRAAAKVESRTGSLAGRLMQQSRERLGARPTRPEPPQPAAPRQPSPPVEPETPAPVVAPPITPSAPTEAPPTALEPDPDQAADEPTDEPPPDGFLAQFGRPEDPPDETR
ncbi:MAG: hypothetical protein IID40_07760, partial [Planctomycetes bacterium]|nr:hypothetical protein [Planctomycetota bacterium]